MEQFLYYLKVSSISIKRAPLPYFLTILIMSVGLGVFFANATFYYWLKHDPLPGKSAQLFHPRMNSNPNLCSTDCEAPRVLSYRDIKALTSTDIPSAAAAMYSAEGYAKVKEQQPATHANIRVTQRDFFSMFDVPVLQGAVWPDNEARMEVIISKAFAQKMFGSDDVVGQSLMLDDRFFKVVAVLDDWGMFPRLYEPAHGGYLEPDADLYLPLETAYDLNYASNRQSQSFEDADFQKLATDGRTKAIHQLLLWVYLPTAEQQQQYRDFMNNLVQSEKAAGRHPNANGNLLHPMNGIMQAYDAESQEVKAFALVTALFLLVCLFNASHLSLNRYIANQYEISLRRALGASRWQLQGQMLADVLVTAGLALLLALLIALAGIALMNHLLPDNSRMASWDGTLIGGLVGLTLLSAYLVTLYPALRASFGALNQQLK